MTIPIILEKYIAIYIRCLTRQSSSLVKLLTWCLYSHIVVRVDTHIILLQTEGKPAGVNGLELMVILQVWPPPQPTVDDVRETLAMRNLNQHTQPVCHHEYSGPSLAWDLRVHFEWTAVCFPFDAHQNSIGVAIQMCKGSD